MVNGVATGAAVVVMVVVDGGGQRLFSDGQWLFSGG